MSLDGKVLWTEGLFLQPQHFQQSDRYHEALVAGLAAHLTPYAWGVSALDIDTEALKVGQFALKACSGLTPDGAVFRMPEVDDRPPALEVPSNVKDCIVHLTVPMRRQGAAEVDLSGAELSAARFRPSEVEIRDTMGGAGSSVMAVGRLRLQFALDVDDLADKLTIPIARIIEVRSDREVILDSAFVPSCLDIRAARPLADFLAELSGLVNHRATALADRLTQAGVGRGAAEIQDVLLLMVLNRMLPRLRHLQSIENVHPESLFADLASFGGELATLMSAERRPETFPAYQHHDLTKTYAPLIRTLRAYLSAVLEQTAVAIPLEARKYGISVGVISDRKLIGNASFVLAVSADLPAENLRRHFAGQAKVGPVEEIRQLVNSALPGIALRPLPVAPRQIPYDAGSVYFECDGRDANWAKMQTSGGIAVHVSGDYPGLSLALWAIRA
jgi:type VI secretion system protein ImpJ